MTVKGSMKATGKTIINMVKDIKNFLINASTKDNM